MRFHFPIVYRYRLPIAVMPHMYLKLVNRFFFHEECNSEGKSWMLLGMTGILMLQLPLSFRFLVFTRVHLDAARMENSRLLGH